MFSIENLFLTLRTMDLRNEKLEKVQSNSLYHSVWKVRSVYLYFLSNHTHVIVESKPLETDSKIWKSEKSKKESKQDKKFSCIFRIRWPRDSLIFLVLLKNQKIFEMTGWKTEWNSNLRNHKGHVDVIYDVFVF